MLGTMESSEALRVEKFDREKDILMGIAVTAIADYRIAIGGSQAGAPSAPPLDGHRAGCSQ
jgi:hypothetical protein